jgi:hypothetical protein
MAQARSDIDALVSTLNDIVQGNHDAALTESSRHLLDSLRRLRTRLDGDADGAGALDNLRHVLFGSFPERLRLLRIALQTGPVSLEDVPEELKRRMTGNDGRVRIEVFPVEDLNDQSALEEYVAAVQSVDGDAYGEGLLIVESGHIVVRALQQALITAIFVIVIILALLWRNILDSCLVAAPLALATIFTVACSVILGIAFNFANVIIIPLLLGVGIVYSIHMVYRVRGGELPDGNLLGARGALERAHDDGELRDPGVLVTPGDGEPGPAPGPGDRAGPAVQPGCASRARQGDGRDPAIELLLAEEEQARADHGAGRAADNVQGRLIAEAPRDGLRDRFDRGLRRVVAEVEQDPPDDD